MHSQERWNQLTVRAARIADLTGASSLLSWDQETLMPSGGTESRAHQMGTLAALIHECYTDPALGELLNELADDLAAGSGEGPTAVAGPPETDRAGIIRAMLRQHEQRTKVPADFVVRRTELSARGREAWKEARRTNTFAAFAPFLNEQFAMARELAGYLGYERNPYDALLDQFEPGTTYSWIDERFRAVKPRLQKLIGQIAGARAADSSHEAAAQAVHRHVPASLQLEFSRQMAQAVGYDFSRGRLDLSAHPFTSGSSFRDVRITTRVDEEYFPSCLFAVIHEAGHGMHGQNLKPALYRWPFRYGLALAESQSRFYENMIGRSRAFWERRYPALQNAVPQFAEVPLDTWYRAVNAVHPSLIRVEADEVTYGMHIMLRFELENTVIAGDLQVGDLPAAWNDAMHRYLGVRPDSDANGVLQDIHWSQGYIGYFPDYLLGSMLSAQLWEAVVREIPGAGEQVREGDLSRINAWMEERVQGEGGKLTFAEAAERSAGAEFSGEPYMEYLSGKYGVMYDLT